MKYAVGYYTRSGNTKKMAETVAEVVGVEAFDITRGLDKEVDVLFLGSSPYAFDFDPNVGEFIEKYADKIGCIVSFGSSASGNSTAKKVRECAGQNGVKFYNHSFKCPGSFLFMHPGRPNEKDLAALRDFTKSVLAEFNK